jgi:hypothetical protein
MKIKRLLVMFLATLAIMVSGLFLKPSDQKVQASAYTIKTFPKRIRGTWYTYDRYDHKIFRIRISAKKLTENKYISRLHSRKKTAYPKLGAKIKHPSWIIGYTFTYKGEYWTQTYGWYQSAGAGDYYRKVNHRIHGKQYATLQLASGAGIWTDGYAYHSKKAAKAYSHHWFKGDRHNRL